MKESFEKATITSIDKTTGRIGIFLRNGLNTSAVYLYDINDLRVGLNVLVGWVSDSYVIFNKVDSRAPVSATKSYSMPEGSKESTQFTGYFRHNLEPASLDDFYDEYDVGHWEEDNFEEDEYGFLDLTKKWEMVNNAGLWYWQTNWGSLWNYKNHGITLVNNLEDLKVWDGKLYLDSLRERDSLTFLETKSWFSGDFEIEMKITLVVKYTQRPYAVSYALGQSPIEVYDYFYADYEIENAPNYNLVYEPKTGGATFYINIKRIGSTWYLFMRDDPNRDWNLVMSRAMGTENVKFCLSFYQFCFAPTGYMMFELWAFSSSCYNGITLGSAFQGNCFYLTIAGVAYKIGQYDHDLFPELRV